MDATWWPSDEHDEAFDKRPIVALKAIWFDPIETATCKSDEDNAGIFCKSVGAPSLNHHHAMDRDLRRAYQAES